ncbi:MAG: hypothetical protein K4571_12485 [Deltaproteobacteria bacterium]
MRRSSQKGTVLITLIIAILLIGVLGVGIYSLTTSSTFMGLLSNNNDQAYQLAQSGIRYKIKNLSDTSAIGDFLMPDNDHKFNISYNDTTKIITSIGIVNVGKFSEARRVILYDVSAYWKTPDTDPYGNIAFGPGTTPITIGNPDAIEVDSDGTIHLGGNAGDASGAIWYQGSSSAGNCNSGSCAFNYGLRAYFDFTSAEDNSSGSTTRGDGFTLTVLSAINNTRDRSGGAPPGISIGELMGYAGPGNTATVTIGPGEGLRPPKMAVEFDTFPNPDGDVCSSASRNDNNGGGGSSFRNHIAVLFWGAALTGSCGTYPKVSYDDNRHESGSGDVSPTPVNSYSGYAGGGYYEGTKSSAASNCLSAPGTTCNWMEDNHAYSVRVEIIRNSSGASGLYQLKAWIYRDTQLPAALTQYRDITTPYSSSAPHVTRMITLSASDHAALRQIFFGFTEATGSATQNVRISNLKFFFPQSTTCLSTISPLSQAVAASGATGQTVTVASGTGCAWTAMSNNAWITIAGGAGGTGPGTVSYNVAANTGLARTGTMTIAGQNFTVSQAAAPPPTCTLSDSPHIVPYNGATTLTWTITDGPADGTWSLSPSGTCGNFTASNGGSCTTGNQTTPGTRTYTLTVSSDTGSNTCSTTFYVGCQGYRVWNETGNRWDFRVTGATCQTSRNDGFEITNGSPQLNVGETVNRYTTAGGGCSSAVQGDISYTDAMNADISATGGNGNCCVNYNAGDTAGDRANCW